MAFGGSLLDEKIWHLFCKSDRALDTFRLSKTDKRISLPLNCDKVLSTHCPYSCRLASLLTQLNSANLAVATTAAAAVWGLATTGTMRRSMADLNVVPMLLTAIKKTMKMQVGPGFIERGVRELCELCV